MSRSLEDTVWYHTRSLLRTFLTTEHTPSIRDPIKRNSMALFKKPQCKSTSKQVKIKLLHNNAALFGQLYVAMQSWNGDLEELFANEIQFTPSVLHSQTLVSCTCRTRSLTCCNVLNSQSNHSLLQLMTAKSWMELLLFTVCLLAASTHSLTHCCA